jgi:transcription elongation factor GreA
MSNFLTQAGLDQLKKRKDEITDVLLPGITVDINEARDQGDLKENAGFQTGLKVRDELMAELGQIDDVLSGSYTIIEEGNVSGLVQLGSNVKLKFLNDNSTKTVKIVGTSESNFLEGKISNLSPLAEAIINQPKGAILEYKIPSGSIKIEILEIK